MLRTLAVTLAAASAIVPLSAQPQNYASSVVAYSPGTGFATDFATGQGLTNAAAALGEPSRSTPGPFGGPVDPFNPPYLGDQIVSIGAGGSLTVGLSAPLANLPNRRFGLDFTIFGNAGFVITNANYTGGGITDGSLFGANSGSSSVSVSADGITFFQLDSARGHAVDTLFPTEGSGNFDVPVDPSLTPTSFGGLDLAGIRALYAGSAGGASFDLDWAQDATGQKVFLPEVRFIRISVLSGAAEIDGLVEVSLVPEPATCALMLAGLCGTALRASSKRSWRT